MDRSFVSTCYSDNQSSYGLEQNFITNNTLANSYMPTSNFRIIYFQISMRRYLQHSPPKVIYINGKRIIDSFQQTENQLTRVIPVQEFQQLQKIPQGQQIKTIQPSQIKFQMPPGYPYTTYSRPNPIVLNNITPLYQPEIQIFPYQTNVNQFNNSQQSVIRSPDKNERSPSAFNFQGIQKYQQRETQQKVYKRIQNTLEFLVKQQKERFLKQEKRDARQEARLQKQEERDARQEARLQKQEERDARQEARLQKQEERDARQEARLQKQEERDARQEKILLKLQETNAKIISLLNQIAQKISK